MPEQSPIPTNWETPGKRPEETSRDRFDMITHKAENWAEDYMENYYVELMANRVENKPIQIPAGYQVPPKQAKFGLIFLDALLVESKMEPLTFAEKQIYINTFCNYCRRGYPINNN